MLKVRLISHITFLQYCHTVNLCSARAAAGLEVSDIGSLVGLGPVLLLNLVRVRVITALDLWVIARFTVVLKALKAWKIN